MSGGILRKTEILANHSVEIGTIDAACHFGCTHATAFAERTGRVQDAQGRRAGPDSASKTARWREHSRAALRAGDCARALARQNCSGGFDVGVASSLSARSLTFGREDVCQAQIDGGPLR